MKRLVMGTLGILLCCATNGYAQSITKFSTEEHNLVLEYSTPMVLKVWEKNADEKTARPVMVFRNGWEPEGVLADGTNCVNRIEFFEDDSQLNEVASLSYNNQKPECGTVVRPKDGSIGTFYYKNGQSQTVEETFYPQ